MRHRILFLALLLLCLTATTHAQNVEIKSLNGYELCNGYGQTNIAYIVVHQDMSDFLPPNAAVVYTWTALHSNGNKVWNTNYPYRTVPLPWEGEYTIQVRVEYLDREDQRPIAVFFSSTIQINATECQGIRDSYDTF